MPVISVRPFVGYSGPRGIISGVERTHVHATTGTVSHSATVTVWRRIDGQTRTFADGTYSRLEAFLWLRGRSVVAWFQGRPIIEP